MIKNNGNSKKKDQISLPEAKKLMPIDISDLELNSREFRFVAIYCTNGFKGGPAYSKAGYRSKNNASRNANSQNLLNRDKIQEAIKRFMEMLIQPYQEKFKVMLLDTYYRRAFYRVDSFYHEDGELKNLEEIEEEEMVVIDGVDTKYFGKDAERKVISYKLADRSQALRTLWEYVFSVFEKDRGKDLPEESRKRIEDIFNRKHQDQKSKIKTFIKKAGV